MVLGRADMLAGTLLGTALGDAIGLPREGLSRRRAARMFGPVAGHRLVLGRGMVSDDTEHACMTGQALLRSGAEPDRLGRSLAWRLRGWLLGLPAGVGFATLRAIGRLWLGWSPATSGVRSAGNGPAMRAPIIGACLHADPAGLRAATAVATRVTHRDPRADDGALAIALAAAHAARHGAAVDPAALLAEARAACQHDESRRALAEVEAALAREDTPAAFAARLGLARGVTGYVLHTVPVALHAWLRRPAAFREVVADVVALGGDTDSVGAIVGALGGTVVGAAALPDAWLAGLCEWPRGAPWVRRLGAALADAYPDGRARGPAAAVPLWWPGLAIRNPLFLAIVLGHGARRLLPPY
ncbi:MAG: ADP-ribosylglycohydrolase family protein [Myxococcales bacterium]|nr:ADP-ribosylglycohydrolase family protein [Myxococcales bacterium]